MMFIKGLFGGSIMRWLVVAGVMAAVAIFFGYGKVRYESGKNVGYLETYLEAEGQVRSVRVRQQRKNQHYKGDAVCANISVDTVVCVGDRLQPQEPDRPIYRGSGDGSRDGNVPVFQARTDSSQ